MRILFACDFHVMEHPDGKLMGVKVRDNADRVFRHIENLAINSSIDLVILGGDLSHDGSQASYNYIAQKLEASGFASKSQIIPGNHDINDSIFRDEFSGLPRTEKLGHSWRAHFLDSRVPGEQFGQIPVATIEYMRSALRRPQRNHLIVLHHDIFQVNSPHRPGMPDGIHDLLKILHDSAADQIVVLSGHRHQFSMVTLQNITLINSGAASCQFRFDDDRPTLDSSSPELLEVELRDEQPPFIHRHMIME